MAAEVKSRQGLGAEGQRHLDSTYGGKATGKGRFSWPSGATYEGEFKSWLLEGSGTFTGASGDTYRGSFSMNLKHGHGRRTYPNGDYYDGEWRKGVQEGHGRYVWKNGHEYNGLWKAGNMSGKGVLFWANGTATTASGTMACPAVSVRGVPEEELEMGLGECKVCPGENMSVFPSQKVTLDREREREDASPRPSTNPPSPPAPLELHHVERLLPNGDFFTGIASHDDRPHGPGKYL